MLLGNNITSEFIKRLKTVANEINYMATYLEQELEIEKRKEKLYLIQIQLNDKNEQQKHLVQVPIPFQKLNK